MLKKVRIDMTITIIIFGIFICMIYFAIYGWRQMIEIRSQHVLGEKYIEAVYDGYTVYIDGQILEQPEEFDTYEKNYTIKFDDEANCIYIKTKK